ncbi:Rft protein-domain-containing protein [Lipomyces arxii]|uniref:Rft protein-domain-containing protein n=1 Tax=Lipomyces arxii TaxID=56418 RepID=UPI0034CD8AC6
MNVHESPGINRVSSSPIKRHGRRRSTIVVPPPAGLGGSKPSPADNASSLIQHTAVGASFLILLQLFSKVLTFILNQALLRFLSPDRLGVSRQLELLSSTILFFAREAIRLALQRQTTSPKPDIYRIEGGVVEGTVSGVAQSVVNTGYIPFLFGMPLAMLLCVWYYFRGASKEVATLPYFKSVVVIYGFASLVELLSEPMFALTQYKLQYKLRALCESGAVGARCVVTFFLTVSAREDTGVLAFALGQLAYALVLTGLYIALVWETTRGKENGIMPKRIWREEISRSPWFYFHGPTVQLASTIWIQTLFKHCLTEGDRLLASYFSTISEQGAYALAANYGSFIARLVFLPIEETVRALFAKLLAPPLTAKNVEFSSDTLTTILRVYAQVSILSAVFGTSVAPFFLSLVAGSTWTSGTSSAPAVLSAYAYYIPLLAFNGVLEAFVQSISTPAQVREQSAAMLGFSVVFAIAGYVFMRVLKLGATGLVYASMVNMALRIGACSIWILRYYREHAGLVPEVIDEKRASSGRAHDSLFPMLRRTAYPSTKMLALSAAAWAAVYATGTVDTWSKFLAVAGVGAGVAAGMAWEERELVSKALNLVVTRKKKVM